MNREVRVGPDAPVYEIKEVALASTRPGDSRVLVVCDVSNIHTTDQSIPYLFLGWPDRGKAIGALRGMLAVLEGKK